MILPQDDKERKQIRIYDGFMKYFANAIVEVTKVSCKGSEQHHPNQELHWDKDKSKEELNSLMRHLLEAMETDATEDWARVAWRAMANLQRKCESKKEGTTKKY